jgi:hypothetical protein
MSEFSILLILSFALSLIGYIYLRKINPEMLPDHSSRRFLKSAKAYVMIGLASQLFIIIVQIVLYWVLT